MRYLWRGILILMFLGGMFVAVTAWMEAHTIFQQNVSLLAGIVAAVAAAGLAITMQLEELPSRGDLAVLAAQMKQARPPAEIVG